MEVAQTVLAAMDCKEVVYLYACKYHFLNKYIFII
jgi:hypothetical protein